jgi:hypothetical protein
MLNYIERLTTPKKADPLTGELFTPERKNQKFATRENQIKYNNGKAALKNKKSNETKSKIAIENKKTTDYPIYFDVEKLTQTEVGKFTTLGLLIGVIFTSVFFYFRKQL